MMWKKQSHSFPKIYLILIPADLWTLPLKTSVPEGGQSSGTSRDQDPFADHIPFLHLRSRVNFHRWLDCSSSLKKSDCLKTHQVFISNWSWETVKEAVDKCFLLLLSFQTASLMGSPWRQVLKGPNLWPCKKYPLRVFSFLLKQKGWFSPDSLKLYRQ